MNCWFCTATTASAICKKCGKGLCHKHSYDTPEGIYCNRHCPTRFIKKELKELRLRDRIKEEMKK